MKILYDTKFNPALRIVALIFTLTLLSALFAALSLVYDWAFNTKIQVFENIVIKVNRFSEKDDLFLDKMLVGEADKDSRWIITGDFLHGVFRYQKNKMYVIYNCQENKLHSYSDIEAYKTNLKYFGITYYDLSLGESIYNLYDVRLYPELCRKPDREIL